MDRLPIEISTHVSNFYDIKALKALCLVNSTLAAAGARFLFESLCLRLLPRCSNNFTQVALHTALRSHIKKTYFDSRLITLNGTGFEDWIDILGI